MLKNVLILFLAIALPEAAVAQSVEDEMLIEAEAAMADSEAAMQEAKEAEKIARAEQRKSQSVMRKAERDIEKARRAEAKAKRRIARAEKQRAKATQDVEEARRKMEDAKTRIDVVKDEMEEVRVGMEEVKRNRAAAVEKRDAIVERMDEIQEDLKNMKSKLASVKKEELATIKSLKRAETRLRRLQDKATISYKTADKDTSQFLEAVQEHRETLAKIAKRLDQLEIEVETDKNFYDKQRRKKLTRTMGRGLSMTNTKVAKVVSSGCNLRAFPSASSKVLTQYGRGKKLRIKKHNSKWYSIIHDGQKAFMGVGCFNN